MPIPKPDFEKIKKTIVDSQIWRSMFRGGVWKNTARDRALHIIGNVWLHLHPVKVRPRSLKVTYSWGLGGLSFLLFLVLTVSGVLLMFYYRPATAVAFQDIKDLEFAVSLGMFWRNLHRWSAHAMVMIVILHMVRVFLTGAYKPPREFNWVIGVVLLLLTFLLSFTGYLLPWDQLALWAITVGSNMAANTPVLGAEGPFSITTVTNDARFALLGGTFVGANALLRFYVLHCVALPVVAGALMMVHFWRVRKDTFSAAPIQPNEEKVDVWPNLIVREYLAAILCIAVLIGWAIWMNAPLEGAADLTVTPNPSKAPWYFAGLQELLVYFDPWIAGVILPHVIVVGLMAFPYLDPEPRGIGYYSFKERKFANTLFLVGVAMWFVLISIGQFMRGPNWAWYWPWESWAHHKPPPPATHNMPNLLGGLLILVYFGVGFILPRKVTWDLPWKKSIWIALGSLIGVGTLIALVSPLGAVQVGWLVFVLMAYFVVGFLMPQRFIRNLEFPRYAVTMMLLLLMLAVLMKIGVRLGFNVKYVFSLPQFSLNI